MSARDSMIWGIFGVSKRSERELHEQVLVPLLQELGRIPDRMLIPSDGNSSIYLQEWAESLHIPTQIFQSDWVRNGRIAQIIRDDRMQKECTHAVVFLPAARLEKMAEKMAKKGKIVFTSSTDLTLTQLVLQPVISPPQASAPARKANTQTMLPFLKCRS